jgi:hypothetical protein
MPGQARRDQKMDQGHILQMSINQPQTLQSVEKQRGTPMAPLTILRSIEK